MKQRIEYFDLLKGIAIFLVVMGHALTMCIRGIDAAFLFKLIGQVHMPIFFFISGFLTYKDTFAPPALKKRFLQLIIPFFVVSALWIWYFPHSSLGSPMSSSLTGMYCSYWKDGYWFTLCLFELFPQALSVCVKQVYCICAENRAPEQGQAFPQASVK